jgi:hypothetical protein
MDLGGSRQRRRLLPRHGDYDLVWPKGQRRLAGYRRESGWSRWSEGGAGSHGVSCPPSNPACVGPKGDTGPAGPAGPPGPAGPGGSGGSGGFAEIASNGGGSPTFRYNDGTNFASVSRPSFGAYCLDPGSGPTGNGISFNFPAVVSATSLGSVTVGFVVFDSFGSGCSGVRVLTYTGTGAPTNGLDFDIARR